MPFPMNQPTIGDTNWGSLVNDNWTTIDSDAERTSRKGAANGYLGLTSTSGSICPDSCIAEEFVMSTVTGDQRISIPGSATASSTLHVLSIALAGNGDVTLFGNSSTNYLPAGALKWLENDIGFIYINGARKFRIGCGSGSDSYTEFTSTTVKIGPAIDLNVLASAQSTAPGSGALVVAGGVGVAKDLSIDGGSGMTLSWDHPVTSGSVATTLGSKGPSGSTAGNPQGWMRVNIAGTDRFMPFW